MLKRVHPPMCSKSRISRFAFATVAAASHESLVPPRMEIPLSPTLSVVNWMDHVVLVSITSITYHI
jgi:hypothetical protein